MADVRRIIVIFVIAILFTVLVQVSIEAFHPTPKYEDFCLDNASPKPAPYPSERACPEFKTPQSIIDSCPQKKGSVNYNYDGRGCPTEAYCETCYKELDLANQKYHLFVFIVSAITGFIALLIGLHLPEKRNPINEWMGSGFLLGGILTIFTGTVRYFGEMGRYMKPIVILIELILIIYLAYKKLGSKKKTP